MSALREVDSGEDVALTLAHVTKRFGATVALDDVSLAVRRGTVHALLGENGAGKTTLMNIAFGLLGADAGTIAVHGAAARIASPADAIRAGLGMVHQHFTNVGAMTVAENVALGGQGRFSARAASASVTEIGMRTGLALDPAARVEALPVGAQQRLEIVKALARNARVLIMDEPTAVLAPAEADELLRWLRGFADAGNAVVLITHKLREALSVADDVTVLRRGRVVHAGRGSELTELALAALLLGEGGAESRGSSSPVETSHATRAVAELDHVSVSDPRGAIAVRDASLTVREGEIVGIAAVEGAGHRELLRALAGRQPATSGTVRVPPSVAFVPEDRHRDAMVADFSLTENVTLGGAGERRGRIRWSRERVRTESLIREYDVRGGGERSAARTLSGGNQQKLVLGRELAPSPRLVVAENPTRGLDIRATAAVHERLRAAARAGAGVVIYSSDLDEVLALATRVLAMHAGRVVHAPLDRDAVGRAMLGLETAATTDETPA